MVNIITHSLAETCRLGEKIGSNLTTGMMITLTGELGSGKTTIVQGLAKGLEVPETYYITSPTYTLINEFPGRLPLYHVDLYRLEGPESFEDIGLYDILDSKGVVAVEWADKLTSLFLSEYLHISFRILEETSRNIHINAYGDRASALLRKIEHK